MSNVWKWWLLANVVFWSVGVAQYFFDIVGFISENDKTYLSFFIFTWFVITSLQLGWSMSNKASPKSDYFWFVSEGVLSLGMVGTLVGFLIVLSSAFTDIDPSNLDSMTHAISVLAVGMSTALLTSLVGLAASLLLKLQLVLLEANNG